MKKLVLGIIFGASLTGMFLNAQNIKLQRELETVQIENNRLGNEVASLKLANNDLRIENSQLYFENKWTSIGQFKITYYCPCKECSGQWGTSLAYPCDGKHKATVNHTVAVDKDIIPIGTKLLINNVEYVAEDIGSAVIGRTIDIYVSTHKETLNQPFSRNEVFIKNEWNLETYSRIWRIIWS